MKINPVKLTAIAALSTIGAMSHAGHVDTAIIDTTNLSGVGLTLKGSDISLNANTFQFPEAGHYCAVKDLAVDYKAGEEITVLLNAEEATKNGLALRVQAWGKGSYKGFGGRSGVDHLIAQLPFDTSKISVGFCRYNNSDFNKFEVNEFAAFHSKQVVSDEVVALNNKDTGPEVYPSCRTYAKDETGETLIIDESEPRTLQQMFNDGTIVPGMTILLRRSEAKLTVSSYHERFMSSDAPWLTIIGDENAKIGKVTLSAVKNIRISGVNIGDQSSGYLASTKGTENIIFDNNVISAGDDHTSWDVSKWKSVGSGMMFREGKCTSAYKNELKNLRIGITTYVNDSEMRPEVQSLKVLVKNNLIKNISADFLRPIGSDITLDGNVGLDHYVSMEDGDSNHDDFIQGFAYPIGTEFENVVITNNYYQASTDSSRAYQSAGQGIVVFDGFYKNFEINNNTLISDMYHGITIFGGKDGVIANNTVTAQDDTSGRFMWVKTASDKSGKYLPQNITVKNNVANKVLVHANNEADSSNNTEISRVEVAANFNEYDTSGMKYDVAVKGDSYYYREGTGSSITTLEQALDNLNK